MLASEKYNYSADKTFKVYAFTSHGPKGVIHKIVRFNELYADTYNLGLGDYNVTTGKISDTSISNNEDTAIIMGTVASIIADFTNIHPNATIIVRGTNTARTRLYQMHINKNWDRIEPLFTVYGLKNDKWEPFRKRTNYDAFLSRRKNTTS